MRSGILGRRGRSGLAGWATKGRTPINGVGEEVVKAESESTGARTYVSRQHSSPQIDKTSLAHSRRMTV